MSVEAELVEGDEVQDVALVRRLRRELKAANTERATLRRQVEALQRGDAVGAAEVEPVEDADGAAAEDVALEVPADAPPEMAEKFAEMQKQLAQMRHAAKKFEEEQERGRAEALMEAAGVPSSLRDLVAPKLAEGADLDGLAAFVASVREELDLVPAATRERVAVMERMDALRAEAVPVGAVRMSYDELTAVKGSDPSAAAALLQSGRVDLPPHVARAIAANREERQNGVFGE